MLIPGPARTSRLEPTRRKPHYQFATASWVCLVEVKTGSNQLEAAQLESYLEVAREEGFDALLTISNEIPSVAGTHPTAVDKRKLRKVPIYHLSWTHVLTQAVMQKVHRGVADPDQSVARRSNDTRVVQVG